MRRPNARKRVAEPKPPDSDEPDAAGMDPIKPPGRPATRSNLFARGHKQGSSSSSAAKSSLLCVAAASLAVAIAGALCYAVLRRAGSPAAGARRYGIVIDGGSTGTRIHVIGYDSAAAAALELAAARSMRARPGLSAFAEDPEAAGGSLAGLIEFGKVQVPRELWPETEVRLMATAGLRLLDPSVRDRILESCRRAIRDSGFKFSDDWASVITGSDEGMYAWVVANYALGSLGGDPLRTTGIIELGGASAQVTFVSNEPMPSEYSRVVVFKNVTYNLYSHSFLHFGQNVAYESLREALISGGFNPATKSLQEGTNIDPCTPKGYSHVAESWKLSPGLLAGKNRYLSSLQSQGNFSECRTAALMMLQKGNDDCLYKRCYIGSTFIPKLRGKFLATENFFHTSKFFGLGQKSYLSNLIRAGQQFCGEDWSTLKNRYSLFHEEDLRHYCFSSAYIVALLHDSLGIALDEGRITVANQVEDIPLDWALGAFILQTTDKLGAEHPCWISTVIGEDSPTLISLIAIFAILIFAVWSISKWRKPELKTIYDLEKGTYIITRVGRYR